ncbi:hypothetical protein GGX14DRAFT_701508 [Mycena pura]|uniref:Uncharacterized protein n=1 Tax=Mycena pura TaxID=153505 RepID=A0AAD6Y2X7_9AGAR|nr:hypothetical protein GGX14DRAFT_701508 [Mycena pura]
MLPPLFGPHGGHKHRATSPHPHRTPPRSLPSAPLHAARRSPSAACACATQDSLLVATCCTLPAQNTPAAARCTQPVHVRVASQLHPLHAACCSPFAVKLRTSCPTRGCRHGYPHSGIRGFAIRGYKYSFPTDGAALVCGTTARLPIAAAHRPTRSPMTRRCCPLHAACARAGRQPPAPAARCLLSAVCGTSDTPPAARCLQPVDPLPIAALPRPLAQDMTPAARRMQPVACALLLPPVPVASHLFPLHAAPDHARVSASHTLHARARARCISPHPAVLQGHTDDTGLVASGRVETMLYAL